MLRLTVFLLLPLVAVAQRGEPNVTLTATWHDNATNADRDIDQVSALETRVDAVASWRYSAGRNDSLHAGLHAAGEWWPRYLEHSSVALGARGEWQHKFGLGAFAPVLALQAGIDQLFAQDSARDGTLTIGTLSFRKRFNDQWRVSLDQDWTEHYARTAAYDRAGTQTTFEVAFDASELTRFTLSLFYYSGDVISYATPPRPELASLANARQPTDIFDRPQVVYSIDAHTTGSKAAFIRAMNESSAAILAYEYRVTERSPFRYVNHLVSVALVHQF
jgi:hypothetical protein